MNEWRNVGGNPNRLLSAPEEMAYTSARELHDLARALALAHCANSDLVGMRWKAAADARERAYEGRVCDNLFRSS